MPTRSAIKATVKTLPFPWTKDQQNKADVFLSAFAVVHVIVRSKKQREKEMKKWITEDIIPRGLQAKFDEQHRAIIEDFSRRVAAIEFESEEERKMHQRSIKTTFLFTKRR